MRNAHPGNYAAQSLTVEEVRWQVPIICAGVAALTLAQCVNDVELKRILLSRTFNHRHIFWIGKKIVAVIRVGVYLISKLALFGRAHEYKPTH